MNVLQKPEVVNSCRKYRVRVLVCAPSNSALDEIVLRVLNTGTSFFFLNFQNEILCDFILLPDLLMRMPSGYLPSSLPPILIGEGSAI